MALTIGPDCLSLGSRGVCLRDFCRAARCRLPPKICYLSPTAMSRPVMRSPAGRRGRFLADEQTPSIAAAAGRGRRLAPFRSSAEMPA